MEDVREVSKSFQTGIVVDPAGLIVGEHKKTSLTQHEPTRGKVSGDSINVVSTPFGNIGLSVCYEIFFPEVTRIYKLQDAKIIFNPINTGMWHEQQFYQWNCIASARASENGLFVVGCSHYNDAIPVAFAYDPAGQCLVQSRATNRMVRIVIDLGKEYEVTNIEQRMPHLYKALSENA